MSFPRLCLIFVLFFACEQSYSQCGFIDGGDGVGFTTPCTPDLSCGNTYRIQIYVLRNALGNGGMDDEGIAGLSSLSDVEASVIEILTEGFTFEPGGNVEFPSGPSADILFEVAGIEYLDDNSLYYNQTISGYQTSQLTQALLATQSNCNAINIYLGGTNIETPPNVSGQAYASSDNENIGLWIGRAVTDANSSYSLNALSPTLVHEMGHVFGLWHIHRNTFFFHPVPQVNPLNDCALTYEGLPGLNFDEQLVDVANPFGTNGDDSGDCVRDTYPFPRLFDDYLDVIEVQEEQTCVLAMGFNDCVMFMPNSSSPYDPDLSDGNQGNGEYNLFPAFDPALADNQFNNYMSYINLDCRNAFTPGQSHRMTCYADQSLALTKCRCTPLVDFFTSSASCGVPNSGNILASPTMIIEPGSLAITCAECPNPFDGTGFTGLEPGEYNITINDGFCTSYSEVVYVGQGVESSYTISVVNESCDGAMDGAIVDDIPLTADIEWYHNGTIITGSSPTGLGSGDYLLTVIDGGSCSSLEVTVGVDNSLVVNAITTSPDCTSDGSGSVCFDLTLAGMNGDYILPEINGQGGILVGESSVCINNLYAGDYTVQFNISNCSQFVDFSIEDSGIEYEIEDVITANCVNMGSFDIFVTSSTGGDLSVDIYTPGYENSANCMALEANSTCAIFGVGPLPAGQHLFQIVSDNGCATEGSLTIENGIAIDIEASSNCTQNGNGNICVDVVCGELPMTIILEAWDGQQYVNPQQLNAEIQNNCFTNLPAGQYQITTSNLDFSVSQPVNLNPSIINYEYVWQPDFTCDFGSLSHQVTGNYPPFILEMISLDGAFQLAPPQILDADDYTIPFDQTETPYYLHHMLTAGAGEYMIMITDANGCSINQIINTNAFDFVITSPCPAEGATQVQIAGYLSGTPDPANYYKWELHGEGNTIITDGVFTTAQMMVNISPTDYEAAVTMDIEHLFNGCTASFPIHPVNVYNVVTLTNCDGTDDLDLCFTPASTLQLNEQLTYEVTDATGTVFASGLATPYEEICTSFSSAGSYPYNLNISSPSSECDENLSIPDFDDYLTLPPNYYYTVEPICGSDGSGSITVTTASGSGDLQLLIEDAEGIHIWESGEPFLVSSPQTLNVSVVDLVSGCTNPQGLPEEVEIEQLSLEITSVTPESCSGNADGAIDITVGGGQAFIAEWSPMPFVQDVEDISGLSGGFYSVNIDFVLSNIVCEFVETVEVLSDVCCNPISSVLTPLPGACYCDNSQIELTVTSGVAPYTFNWTGPSGYTSLVEDIDELVNEGTYSVTITDINGCQGTHDVVLDGSACQYDFDCDGIVGTGDLMLFLPHIGENCGKDPGICGVGCCWDLNSNCTIETTDMLQFLAAFGQPCQ